MLPARPQVFTCSFDYHAVMRSAAQAQMGSSFSSYDAYYSLWPNEVGCS